MCKQALGVKELALRRDLDVLKAALAVLLSLSWQAAVPPGAL